MRPAQLVRATVWKTRLSLHKKYTTQIIKDFREIQALELFKLLCDTDFLIPFMISRSA